MKPIIYNSKLILFVISVTCLISCNKEFERFETPEYSVSTSCIPANEYYDKSGSRCSFPFLPGGLFITWDQYDLPKLDIQSRREAAGIYPVHNLQKIFDSDEYIVVSTVEKNYLLIHKDNPESISSIKNLDVDNLELLFDAQTLDSSRFCNLVQNALCLQDKVLNRKEHVSYSTPVIDGIIELCLYDRLFYFGETIYSYFMLNVKTGELKFFKSKADYDGFCKMNIHHAVEILKPVYAYN